MDPTRPRPDWTPEIELGPERVRELLAAAFPELDGADVEPLGEGFDNLAVRVAGRWVFRFPRRELGARLFANEVAWLSRHAGRLPMRVPVPERVSGPCLGHPFPFGGYREIVGTTACRANLDESDRAALAAPLGAFLGALHALGVPEVHGGDPLRRSDVRRRGLRAVERAREVPGADVAAVERAVAAGVASAPWSGRPTWVHGDLYGRHLVVDRGRLVGVIDWGDVHVGDPAIDLSIGWSFLPSGAHAAFLAAYGLPVDQATWARARAVALDYGAILSAYGASIGDRAAEALGRLALTLATAAW